ncbi:cytokine receptor domeless [Biomphalaria pfeifferi]|uniref:Cytokine receptor domeless n=1 Tax=Biomphalaria pfeifferi TaxID=112525 RepID=A0AAD8FLX2_BIOPF|nr:cytokine receptor domeless [Biomphalaria pfeifferi]
MKHFVTCIIVIFHFFQFGLLCSKSTCKLGRICMDTKPIVFAGSVLEVCCTINASFTGELVEFEYLKTKVQIRTQFGTRKVCYNFTLFPPDSQGHFSFCRVEPQRQCNDLFLIVVEKPFPRTFNADCYTQFPNLVCQWEMPTFIVERRNVTVTMNVEVLNSNARQLNTIHCGNATACILNLSDLWIWANDFPVNVSLTLTYKDAMLELSSISTPWYWIHPDTSHKEKLQLEKFSVTNITSTCLTIHWTINLPDIFNSQSAITNITLETDGETHYANKVNGDVNRPGNQTICNLTPFTTYNVSLTSRFTESTVWSDTIQTTFVTLPDVPKCGPEVSPDGYSIIKNDQSYQAVVYWKIPSNRDWRSDTQLGYYIYQNYSNEGKVLKQELGQSISLFRTTLAKHGTTSLYIKSKNNDGEARCSAHVFKFQENQLQKDISNVQAFWKNGVVEVTWTTTSSFNIMATVYWCKFSNETDICNSPIQWLEVGNVHLRHPSIQLSLTEAQTFQYGVSVFNSITNTSAGITWTMCLKAFQDGKEILSRNCAINLNKVDSLVTVTVTLFAGVVLLGTLVYFICKCHKRKQEINGLYNNSSEHERMIDTNNCESVTNNCQNSSESSCNQSSESAQSEGIVSTASSDVSSQCSKAEAHLTPEWTNDVLRSTTDSGQTENVRELNGVQILNGSTRPNDYVSVYVNP